MATEKQSCYSNVSADHCKSYSMPITRPRRRHVWAVKKSVYLKMFNLDHFGVSGSQHYTLVTQQLATIVTVNQIFIGQDMCLENGVHPLSFGLWLWKLDAKMQALLEENIRVWPPISASQIGCPSDNVLKYRKRITNLTYIASYCWTRIVDFPLSISVN